MTSIINKPKQVSNKTLFLHTNFTVGNEISREEVLEKLIYGRNNQVESIHSHCLDLFNIDMLKFVSDIFVVKAIHIPTDNRDGIYGYISLKELLTYNNFYTHKEIRKEHNVHKMLLADSLDFKSTLNIDIKDGTKELDYINKYFNNINKKDKTSDNKSLQDEVMSQEMSDEWCSVDHIIANALSGK